MNDLAAIFLQLKGCKNTDTDRNEKSVVPRAPLNKTWRAIIDSSLFGEWFKVKFETPFVAGETIRGQITHPGYEHVAMDFGVGKIEPESYFSYRGHPFAVDTAYDYSGEPVTLVEFFLEEALLEGNQRGTKLRIVESGFDGIPFERWEEAFRKNDGGWTGQVRNIEKYVAI